MKRGVIFIAGNVGTGKSTLAQALSEKIGAKHYDIDEIKKIIYPTDPEYAKKMNEGIPISDEIRRQLFVKVAEDIRELSREYDLLVIDEVFQKKDLRNMLFNEAKMIFGEYRLFKIESDESIIRERLLSKTRTGHILTNPLKMYETIKKSFEPIEEPHTIIMNNDSVETSLAHILSFL